MSFEERLNAAIEDIEVPASLSPESIETMLLIAAPEQVKADAPRPVPRPVLMRTLAALAACAALFGGFVAMRDRNVSTDGIASDTEYHAVQVQSYDELYNIYSGIYESAPEQPTGAGYGDGTEIITDDAPAVTPAVTAPAPAQVSAPAPAQTAVQQTAAPAQTRDEAQVYDYSDADIVKAAGDKIYYLCSGTVFVVDSESCESTAQIKSRFDPDQMYINGSALTLVSSGEDITGESFVTMEIYDISGDEPEHLSTYRQCGELVSLRTDTEGNIFAVTSYRTGADSASGSDLDSFVPSYYINGTKQFVSPTDIFVPRGADTIDYTVVSTVSADSASVMAVLGSNADVYTTDSTVYVTGTLQEEGHAVTSVTSFDITSEGLVHRADTQLPGSLISHNSMAESGGSFRIATAATIEGNIPCTNIYTLSDDLTITGVKRGLLPETAVASVVYEGSTAGLVEKGSTEPALTIDLDAAEDVSEPAAPGFDSTSKPMGSDSSVTLGSSEEGGLVLSLWDAEGNVTDETRFAAELITPDSPALTDRRALLCDPDSGIIGVPVSADNFMGTVNRYYIFKAEGGSIRLLTAIECDYAFERAMTEEGRLLIFGSGRITSVDLEDMSTGTVQNMFLGTPDYSGQRE